MNAWPQSLRPVAKYVARGNEVQATHPIVAFYCNLHAVKEAIHLNKGDGEVFIRSLLEKTEALKKLIGPNDDSHQQIVEEYALERFAEADDEDMSGEVTAMTAKKYFTALCFMDVCKVFKARSDEIEKKSNFTKSRMVAIQKALREGTDPRRPELIQAERESFEEEETSYQPSAPPSAPVPDNEPMYPRSASGTAPMYSQAASDTAPMYPQAASDAAPMYPPSNISYTSNDSYQRPNTTYPADAEEPADRMSRLSLNSASAYPGAAPLYESFVDPTPGRSPKASLHIPPSRPVPSIPNSSRTVSPAPSIPYISSPSSLPSAPVEEPDYGRSSSGLNPTIEQVKNAQTNAKHAVSALDFEDYAGAISFLEQAIADLKSRY